MQVHVQPTSLWRGTGGDAPLPQPVVQETSCASAAYLVREGQLPQRLTLLVSGLAQRHKIVSRGARQIIGLCVPGDLVDLDALFLTCLDHSVQALTPCTLLSIERDWLRDRILNDPEIARAAWVRTLADAAIAREWQANIGRRSALARTAHLLCELHCRMGSEAPGEAERFVLPLTQAQLADTLGLTPVHVNRVLRELEQRGLIARSKREIVIPDWSQLQRAADFNPRYLHRGRMAGQDLTRLLQTAD